MSLYYGYSVGIQTLDDAAGRVTFSFSGRFFTVGWAAAQTATNRGLDVHVGAPTTVSRRLGASGLLFVKDTTCATIGLAAAGAPAFAQQSYRICYGTVQVPGGQNSALYIDALGRRVSFDWADRSQSWLGAPSTLRLDPQGYPTAGLAGWVCVSDTKLLANGAPTAIGGKWPEGLGGVTTGRGLIMDAGNGSDLDAFEPALATVVSTVGPMVDLVFPPQDGKERATREPVRLSPTLRLDDDDPCSLVVYPNPAYTTLRFDIVGEPGIVWLHREWTDRKFADKHLQLRAIG